jgi:hypothetical protein
VVEADGDLNRSSGGVTSVRTGFAQFRVDFGQNVSACMYLANIGDPGSSFGDFGVARPRRDSTNPNRVLVETLGDIDGFGDDPHLGMVDLPFHIAAFC